MNDIKIIVGEREDIPTEYLEQLFALQQLQEEEKWGILPSEIELFRIKWKVREEYWLKRLMGIILNSDNLVVGFGSTGWHIKYDNLDRGWFHMFIVPEYRKNGHGKLLLKALMNKIPDQIKYIYAGCVLGTSGEHFLRRIKENNDYQENRTAADLSELDLNFVRKEASKYLQQTIENGYKIIQVENMSFEKYVNYKQYVNNVQQIWKDMPREELTYEDDIITPEKYREMYDIEMLNGDRYISFLAIHEETNEPVGVTNFNTNLLHKQVVWQDDTGVIPEHRGNGLGLAMKYQSLLYLLEETDAKYWITGNAGSNEHMIKINKTLNHKLWLTELEFELKREEIEKYLKS